MPYLNFNYLSTPYLFPQTSYPLLTLHLLTPLLTLCLILQNPNLRLRQNILSLFLVLILMLHPLFLVLQLLQHDCIPRCRLGFDSFGTGTYAGMFECEEEREIVCGGKEVGCCAASFVVKERVV